MKAILRTTGFFLAIRLGLAMLTATPVGLALRSISGHHPDGDDALFADFLPRLGDVLTREPRMLTLAATAMLLLCMLAPLGEGLVDRVGTAMLDGRSAARGLGDAASEAFRLVLVSVSSALFRGAVLACVVGLFRHRELEMRALAIPATLSALLLAFAGIVLAIRDLVLWPSAPTLRGRTRIALLVLLAHPVRMVVFALGARALSLAFTAVAFVASTSPAPLHGGRLALVYALAGSCWLAAAFVRALRLAGFGALAERVRPRAESTDDRFDEPGAPNLGRVA